jgi:hypothetical protein
MELVRESPWQGIGRGAVETNQTRVHPASAYFTFSHLENEYVSALVEWGVVGALVMGGAFAWCVVAAVRRWRDGPLAAAALGALAMILFQSAVDFGIELLGIAVPVVIIGCTVQFVPLKPSGAVTRATILRVALIAALVLSSLVLVSHISVNVQEDHDSMLATDHPKLDRIRASIQRHPLDYFSFGIGADVSSSSGDVHAVEYLNQALALHPTHPGLHRLAARMLVGLKRYDQAAVEYSLAMSSELSPRRLLNELVLLLPNADLVAAAIPTDYPNLEAMLNALDDLKRPDISELWLARVADQPQHEVRVIDMLYDLAMARNDLDGAKRAAELRLRVSKTTTSKLALAKVRFARGEYDQLMTELADVRNWTGRIDEKAEAWLIQCDVLIKRRTWDPALECLHRLEGSGLVTNMEEFEVTKRTRDIREQREYEAKVEAAKALEKSLNAPKK